MIRTLKRVVLTLFLALLLGALVVHLFDRDFAGEIYRRGPASALATSGKALYEKLACQSCHGSDGKGPILPDYPIITGQQPDYLFNQMKHIRDGIRTNGGSSYMKEAMGSPSDDDLKAIAAYLATLD